MDRQLTTWKALADRFWSANMPDYREAAQLTAEIASASDDALRHAAMQALPSLRNALAARADRGARDLAKRRFSLVRDRLHTLTAPRFGRRGGETGPLTSQERNRHCLACRSAARSRRRKSSKPTSASPKPCTPTAGAARGSSLGCWRRATR
jgi:hypothetical protein